MKVLVINGSPKGARSNTLRLTQAFVEGLGAAEYRQVDLAAKKLGHCTGCFHCWGKTPGKCVLSDDMEEIIASELWADVIVWSFPLYYFNVPGLLKNAIDRRLPMNLPFMVDSEDGVGSGSHPPRYDMSGKRYVLISTCGFYSAENNYDSILAMFDHICGRGRYETIFCGQGELFRIPELKARTDAYLEQVKMAGTEFASGAISDERKAALGVLLYPKETFERMADASWGLAEDGASKADETLSFTKQMAALYNPAAYDGRDRVLEIVYTDKNKRYQIVLGKDNAEVREDASSSATTVIETPWDVWRAISRRELRGDEALMQGLYKVKGDLGLMLNWERYFGYAAAAEQTAQGGAQSAAPSARPEGRPTMLVLLAPWTLFWVAAALPVSAGLLGVLLFCASLPLLSYRRMMTRYDRISLCLVGGLAVFAYASGLRDLAYSLSYLCFGLLWLLSCLTKEPLCAAYVKYNYGGEDALKNPLFLRTNVILAAAWGALYLLMAGLSHLMFNLDLRFIAVLASYTAPALLGIFTAWFQKWYPSYVAGGKAK